MTTASPPTKLFTRQEAIALCRVDTNRIPYLERKGLVTPQRFGITRKPLVFFSWEQLLSVRLIGDLKAGGVPKEHLHVATDLLLNTDYDDSMLKTSMVALNNKAAWLDCIDDLHQLIPEITRVTTMSLTIIPPLTWIVQDLWDAAKQSPCIDFEMFKARAKCQP